MAEQDGLGSIGEQVARWREYLLRRRELGAADIAELEDHLREHVTDLIGIGLAADEAFLVAIRRIGDLDSLSREFAREHSERLWKQLVMPAEGVREAQSWIRSEAAIVFGLAAAAAAAVKLPAWFGVSIASDPGLYLRNASLFALPLLAAYFVWKRREPPRFWVKLSAVFVLAALCVNAYPFARGGSTASLAALHLPIVLWLTAGVAYAGDRWRRAEGRMDFIRFSGEWLIYFVLLALGGMVLAGLTAAMFRSIGVRAQPFLQNWLAPCGAAGAAVVAAWLVEAKQSVIENMAPVLTRLFTPLFTAMLFSFFAALAWMGRGVAVERHVLLDFNLLLLVVLGLLLYAVSARPAGDRPGLFDVLQFALVASALLADGLALWAIMARIGDYGFSPNRVAVLGVNLVLLVNLAVSAVLYAGILRRRIPFARLARWQTGYLGVFACWVAAVVVLFPPLFGYR